MPGVLETVIARFVTTPGSVTVSVPAEKNTLNGSLAGMVIVLVVCPAIVASDATVPPRFCSVATIVSSVSAMLSGLIGSCTSTDVSVAPNVAVSVVAS